MTNTDKGTAFGGWPRVLRAQVAVAVALIGSAVIGGCGGTPARPSPGLPAAPTGLVARAGDAEVTLTWASVAGAAAYDVYFATSTGIASASARGPSVTSTTATVGALRNGTRYWFAVRALNASGEGPASTEVDATPAARVAFSQADLAGTWRFAVLSAGAGAGWARGALTVDPRGNAAVQGDGTGLPYADSAGRALPAGAGPFPVLLVDSAGHVRNAAEPAGSTFDAVLGAARRDVIVGTTSSGGTRSIAILLKHDPAVTFAAGSGSGTDISGWGGGGTGGGSRRIVYDQISTGAEPQEWEFAAGQIGQASTIQYASGGGAVLLPYLAPSGPPRPSDKTTALAIDAGGVVTESLAGIASDVRPVFLLDHGFMSDDRSLVVGVGLAPDPAAPAGTTAAGRHVLRVYHVTNVASTAVSADETTGTQADLVGTWAFRSLTVGAATRAASGTLTIDPEGAVSFSSWADDAGGTAPDGFVVTMLPPSLGLPGVTQLWGTLSDGVDPTLHGKLSYQKDLVVITRTEPTGGASFTVGLR